MKLKKALVALVCAAALVTATFLGTMAYFTDNDSVTNPFTVGKVGIDLKETKVDKNGVAVSPAEKTDEGNLYHLIPGQTYIKDPTVTVDAKSEESYIYMTVTVENIDKLKEAITADESPESYVDGVFLLQNLCDWQADSPWKYKGFDGTNTYRFAYKTTVTGEENADKALEPLFSKIIVPGKAVTNDDIEELQAVKIHVNAYAVQAAGFANLDVAWSATFGENTNFTINN